MSEVGYLLDTNIISETRKKRPEPKVIRFLKSIESKLVCLSVLTIGELRRGAILKRRTDEKNSDDLSRWIDRVEETYQKRLLPIDLDVASVWARLSAGRPRPIVDALIAATAIAHRMTLVTRDVDDVSDTGVAIVNPWKWNP